jgi:SAM-dependent methyltransferase
VDILNLGAGNRLVEGAVNHDLRRHRPEIDVVHDLNVLPWPWADESFDLIVARSVFEHLDRDLVACLDQCWRILRSGGEIQIKVPHWQADAAYQDPTHRWRFTLGSFDVFDPDTARGQEYSFYTDRKWRITKGPRLNNARTSVYATLQVRK